MRNNYLKTLGSMLIVGAFLFLAFGSEETESNVPDRNNNSSRSNDKNNNHDIDSGSDKLDDSYSNPVHPKRRGGGPMPSNCITCNWCGGHGQVGIAGESVEQVNRTGMGLGNPCITCGGDGCK